MKLETFFDKFELFADAPDAVQKMRELILNLAVQGKLVDQDSREKFALESLRNSTNAVTALHLVDRAAPSGWVVVPLGCAIASNTGGGTPSKQNPAYWDGSIPWASVKDIQSDKYLNSTVDAITEEGLRNSSSNLIPKNRLLVVTRMGLGKLAINKIPVAINQDLRAIEPNEALDLDYAYMLFKGLKLVGKGVTVKGVTLDELHSMTVSIPPVAEQKRIVAKVDELMALCDRLEARQQERQTQHTALARASLARFADAPTPTNLNFLFHKSYTISPADLRKSILTLAVQGKLVEQDANDEAGEELIQRIMILRERLLSGKRGKTAVRMRALDESKTRHDLPVGWTWCRLGDVVLEFRYGTSRKCSRTSSGVPVLRIPNIQGGVIESSDLKFTDMPIGEFEELRLQNGDLLIVRSNGSESLVGRSAVTSIEDERFAYAGYLVRARLSNDSVFAPYIHVALSAPSVRDQIEGPIRTTSGVKNINTTELSNLVFGLPPLAEQRRIVAKVDQLMALVDQLEAQLTTSHSTAEKLTAAIVAELTLDCA